MQAAQKLYEGVDDTEGGLITYMRTDGLSVSPEGIAQAREVIADRFGPAYVPEQPPILQDQGQKNAQEAHEAIRPTNLTRHPDSLRLEGDLSRLYDLIWKRMVASQMESARLDRTTVESRRRTARPACAPPARSWPSTASSPSMRRSRRQAQGRRRRRGRHHPPARAEGRRRGQGRGDPHRPAFHRAAAALSEATLVKKLEELGIGRPSTYASILTTLRDREYVRMDKNRFMPEDNGRLVTAFLEQFFTQWVQYDFTAALETQLDEVSAGDLDWKVVLRDFWSHLKPATDAVTANVRASSTIWTRRSGPSCSPTRATGRTRACARCANRAGCI
jgi:DNA topoisomerase-1